MSLYLTHNEIEKDTSSALQDVFIVYGMHRICRSITEKHRKICETVLEVRRLNEKKAK